MYLLDKRRLLWSALPCLVIVAVLWVYWPGLNSGYFFDDSHTLQKNDFIKISDLEYETLSKAAHSFLGGNRAISMLSFALNHYFFGDSTWHYKLINLLIHVFNGLILYFLSLRLLAVPNIAKNFNLASSGKREVLALTLMVLWLVAPINLPAVLYISQRMTLLAGFFTLAGCLFYTIWRSECMHKKGALPVLFSGLFVFATCAYMSKENGVLLFLYAFVIEIVAFRFRHRDELQKKLIFIYAAGIIAVVFAISYKFSISPRWILSGYEDRPFELTERVLTQFRALWFYIWQILAPANTQLGLWHDDFLVSTGVFSPLTTLPSMAGIASLLGVAILILTRVPAISFGILWFFAGHSIESTVIALEIMHEHRNYLASYGVLLALLVLVSSLKVRGNLQIALILSFIVAHTFVLHQRVQMWSNDFLHSVAEAVNHPNSGASHYDLGRRYYSMATGGVEWAGDKARGILEIGSRNDPYSITSELLLALLAGQKIIEYDPKWLQRAALKLSEHPYSAPSKTALQGFKKCLHDQVCELPEKDVRNLFEAAFNSDSPNLLTTAAVYYGDIEQDFVLAEKAFRRAWQIKPGRPILWLNYIRLLDLLNKKTQACELFAEFQNREFDGLQLLESDISEISTKLEYCGKSTNQSPAS